MKYIVVTDLDGTLLDHQTYQFTAALDGIQELKQRGIPLILNSSKTQAEIIEIRAQLNNQEPFVCENGGILCGMANIQYLATPRSQFLQDLAVIKAKLNLKYQGFAEVTVDEVMHWTGLSASDAENAMKRDATEPLLWQDTELALNNFRQELAQIQLQCVKGGRFHHVMGFFNKATCFSQLKEYYAQVWQEEISIIALGDSPNDLPMLEQADYAVVIPNSNGNKLHLNQAATYFASKLAPDGWQEGISFVLEHVIKEP
ncbi:MAG: HAD-IIB family hydrolase [Cyanobacteria bacterium P01_A01_bin.40]